MLILMKVDFYNTLKYTDLLIPLIKMFSNQDILSDDEIISNFKKTNKYQIYNTKTKENEDHIFKTDEIINEAKDALFYISKTPYINYIRNDQLQITQDGKEFLKNLHHKKNNIQKRNLEENEEKSKIIKVENSSRNKIIDKIEDYYNIPSKQFFYNPILEYLNENRNHNLNRRNMNLDILSNMNFSDEMMKILTGGKSIILFVRINFAVKELKDKKFIKNKEKGPFQIDKKGLKYLNDPNLIKIVDESVKENEANESLDEVKHNTKTSKKNISNQLRINTYNNIILNLLSDEEEYKRKNIISNTIRVLVPNYDENEIIFNTLKNPIKKSINKLFDEKLIQKTEKKDYYKITQKGHDLLNKEQYEIKEKSSLKNKVEKEVNLEKIIKESESDLIEKIHLNLNESLPKKLLKKVQNCDPYFFEKLSLDLLKKMDFYKVKTINGEVTSKSNDGGVDGLIYLGPLSIPVYFQSKRWKNNISRPEMQKFVGALTDKSADIGIFITTSSFTKGAIETAKTANIRLIDGKTLVKLMIKYKVGIKIQEYEIKMIDENYFED